MKRILKIIDRVITSIPVSEIMIKDVKTLNLNESSQEAVEMMAKFSISGIIIVDNDENPVGMVSEGDLLKKVFHRKKNSNDVKLKEIMSKGLTTISPNLSVGEVGLIMKKKNISKLPIVKNKKIIGYVTKSDLLEKLNEIYYQNRQLIWLSVVITLQFVIIAILLLAYIKK